MFSYSFKIWFYRLQCLSRIWVIRFIILGYDVLHTNYFLSNLNWRRRGREERQETKGRGGIGGNRGVVVEWGESAGKGSKRKERFWGSTVMPRFV